MTEFTDRDLDVMRGRLAPARQHTKLHDVMERAQRGMETHPSSSLTISRDTPGGWSVAVDPVDSRPRYVVSRDLDDALARVLDEVGWR